MPSSSSSSSSGVAALKDLHSKVHAMSLKDNKAMPMKDSKAMSMKDNKENRSAPVCPLHGGGLEGRSFALL